MRIAAIAAGIILLVAGIWVIAGNGSYQSSDTVLEAGPVSIEAKHKKPVPQWTGIAGIVVGGVLVVGGFAGRHRGR